MRKQSALLKTQYRAKDIRHISRVTRELWRRKATIRCRSLKMSLPRTLTHPRRVFQKRMRVLIMSLVQTGEQRNAAPQERTESRRGRWSPLLRSKPGQPRFLCPSVSLFSRASPRPLLFYFWFEALFNFCREIFPPRNDYCSPEIAEMEEGNRIRFARPSCLRTHVGMQSTDTNVKASDGKSRVHLRREIKRQFFNLSLVHWLAGIFAHLRFSFIPKRHTEGILQ